MKSHFIINLICNLIYVCAFLCFPVLLYVYYGQLPEALAIILTCLLCAWIVMFTAQLTIFYMHTICPQYIEQYMLSVPYKKFIENFPANGLIEILFIFAPNSKKLDKLNKILTPK